MPIYAGIGRFRQEEDIDCWHLMPGKRRKREMDKKKVRLYPTLNVFENLFGRDAIESGIGL